MSNKVRFLAGALATFLLCAVLSVPSAVFGQDPSVSDTIKFGNAVVYNTARDTTIRVQVWFSFDETNMQAIDIPLRWSSPDVNVDVDSGDGGVDWTAGIGYQGAMRGLDLSIPDQRGFLYSVRTAGNWSSSAMASWRFCDLFFKVPAGTAAQQVTIDTTFFPPSNQLIIIDGSAASWVPNVVSGGIAILPWGDDDHDGVGNQHDNCISTYNPDQKDGDRDDIGNACDPCDCTHHCDLNLDGNLNPVDMVTVVNYVYKGIDNRQTLPTTCPKPNGDWDCFGGVNPVDVVWYVNFVHKGSSTGPCDPCATK